MFRERVTPNHLRIRPKESLEDFLDLTDPDLTLVDRLKQQPRVDRLHSWIGLFHFITPEAIKGNPSQGNDAGLVRIEIGKYAASLQAKAKTAGTSRHYWECFDSDAHSA